MSQRDARHYTIDGVRYPSVTTILGAIAKPALVNWAAKVEREACLDAALELLTRPGVAQSRDVFFAEWESTVKQQRAATKAKEAAGDIGRAVHALIESDLREELGLPSKGAEQLAGVPATDTAYLHWLEWRDQHKVKPLRTEFVVCHPSAGYAGTADLLAEVDGAVTLLDFKTGRAVYPEAHLQLVAYAHAAPSDPPIEAGLILRLPKTDADPTFDAVPVDVWNEGFWSVFLAVKRLWEWWHAA